MSTSGIGGASWLTSYDPTNPSTLTALLNASPADPANSLTPAGFQALAAAGNEANGNVASGSRPLSPYEQTYEAIRQASDTLLIEGALGIGATAPATDSLTAALQADEQLQAGAQSAQSQAALSAAQSALDAGQTIDTRA